MKSIEKIKLQNFKRFKSLSIDFAPDINILVGDNESGKSSVLSAINLVLSGSTHKVESAGLESLFNSDVIREYLQTEKKIEELPVLFIEVYLNEQNNADLNGNFNSERKMCDGLRLECSPNDDLSKEIKEILLQPETNFPFEYYSIKFNTFQGEGFTGYRRYVKHLLIDNSLISSEYAIKEFVKDMYNSYADIVEKNKHQNEYRKHKDGFKTNVLTNLNAKLTEYNFSLKNNSKANLETDLTLCEDEISIDNKGKGKQCFIKTEFALNKKEKNLDFVLIEEPENHLSHINMKRLILKINESTEKQLFISTHSNMISSRLDLRKSILLNSNSNIPIKLQNLPESTAKFFIKAPENNILDFILSEKVILVEGDAEFILMEAFYRKVLSEELANSGVHILSVGGTSFKRYLDVAKQLKIKTVVIRDNDGKYQDNCIDLFTEYTEDYIKVFGDSDNTRSTFEICIYQDNKAICDGLFSAGRKTLSVQEYMLKNKAGVALELLEKKAADLNVPKYIEDAIKWIKV
ncbi:MAG: AAA family ATPase [Sphingobacteriaceae bacterium]|nr:AAA family ATPase [Sphingobacteriaceae bacterium]